MMIDGGNISALDLFQLSETFDTIDHHILLLRPLCFMAFAVLHTTGSHRTAFVTTPPLCSARWNSITTYRCNVWRVGNPQDSVLGPLLSVLFYIRQTSIHSLQIQSRAVMNVQMKYSQMVHVNRVRWIVSCRSDMSKCAVHCGSGLIPSDCK